MDGVGEVGILGGGGAGGSGNGGEGGGGATLGGGRGGGGGRGRGRRKGGSRSPERGTIWNVSVITNNLDKVPLSSTGRHFDLL